jgi:acyl-homoserine-lactone acylase
MRRCVFSPLLALLTCLAAAPAHGAAASPDAAEIGRWERQAARVTIVRDDWGIAHVFGKTDADAVFGMEYAQAEDDFHRVEMNYLNALGRLSEAEGKEALYKDLRMRLYVDPDTLQALYRVSPTWLRALMDAFADGLNFYLHTHPSVTPLVLRRFEPWMALGFTEGSIGWDIERIDLAGLAAFYGAAAAHGEPAHGDGDPLEESHGSNGIAIAPKLTRDHHTLFWINPHTSHYFRSELQVTSEQGLNAYGAVTWGQFFVYQGFNRTAGWMHTSSRVDNIDEFFEAVTRRGDHWFRREGDRELPIETRLIRVPYKTDSGMAQATFAAYFTPHGPVVRALGDRWVSVSLMQKPVQALTQSYTRTKAKDYAAFRRIMELHANSSNNTVFADASGNIAYFHSNYIPRRDTTFDWTKPVDGADPRTAYRGLLSVDETPHALNPSTGWLYNSNNWPWSVAGPASPRRESYPRYVETQTEETPRGMHALRLLTGSQDWTMDGLAAAAFDGYLPSFARLIPVLLAAYDRAPMTDSLKMRLAEPVAALRGWDFRWGVASIPTSLAVFWGEAVTRRVDTQARAAAITAQTYAAQRATPEELLEALGTAVDTLTARFGTWRTPWGEINRFQRLGDDIAPRFDDARPSIPVPFTSGTWGSLASADSKPYPGTRKSYDTGGNSFVAVVEFGPKLRARAITAGGASGDPTSPHFDDQAERFVAGRLREVYLDRSQLRGHTERTYHPGE